MMTSIKTLFWTILLVFLLVPTTMIAADQEDETKFETSVFITHMMNGKPWIKLDQQSRIMYVSGIEDGANLLIAEMDSVYSEKGNASASIPAVKRLMIKGFRMSDIVEEIDRFYEQASNRRIPVVDAYRYVLKKFKGASPEELAATQSALRTKYNR
jgi:hypothetical protein